MLLYTMGCNIKRRRLLQGVGAVGVMGLVGAQSAGAQERNPLDRHIVGVEPGEADIARNAAEEVYRVLDFGNIGMAVSGWFTDEALDGLENNPNVRYIEEEGIMEAIDHTVDEDDGDPTEDQVLPWGIDRVDGDVTHHDGETGAGSSISIIDTGIDPTHETLDVTGGRNFVDCDNEDDDADCADDWDDGHGHGTHCSGTANALDNEIGVVGVATEADMYAVRVLDDDGSGTWSDVAAGIKWTPDEGIAVGSLSLGGGHSETVQNACEYAYENGTLLVAAAGNDGPRPNSVSYPAAYEECIAVSATDETDDIARFSSRGEEVELAAPGVNVLSSVPGDEEYDEWNGTSMACPHVSGAGVQLMANGYSNTDAREKLNDTAEDIDLEDTEQGNGLLDVAAALGNEDDDEADDEENVSVETRDASEVGETSATLNGEVTELENADEADVGFEYGESGGDLDETVDAGTLDSVGEFDATIDDLDPDTDYEFRAVAETDSDSDEGDMESFNTEEYGDEDIENDPVIEQFDVSTRTSGPWWRADVDWEVSHEDDALDEVTSELLDEDGSVLDSETTQVSGGEASGEHNLRTRDEPPEKVRLIVTDTNDGETSETKDYDD